MLHFLNIFFTVFHTAFILFVLTGWAFPTLRKIHLFTLLSTLAAWLLIGLYIGKIGYCPLTDWHWDVKRALGETHLNPSFVGYMFENYLGFQWSLNTYNAITIAGLVFGFFMSGYLAVQTNRFKRISGNS